MIDVKGPGRYSLGPYGGIKMRPETTENKRKKLIQLIHIGKAKMRLSDDAYRAFLDGICGKESCADMTMRQLAAVLKAMRGNGFGQAPRFLTVRTVQKIILALRDMSAKAAIKASFDPSDRESESHTSEALNG